MVNRTDFSAVIFDLDGLVLDTESTFRLAWREAARELGHEFSKSFWESLSGLPAEEVMAALAAQGGAGFDFDEFNRLSALCWRRHVAACGIEVKHGFHPLLEWLVRESLPYCLATNSHGANARECLALSGLEQVFPVVISREQVARGKPAPDLFLQASRRLGVPIGRCLVLEDSAVGIQAASKAGALSVLIPSASSVDHPAAALCTLQVGDLAQLQKMLAGE
jgi:beta-phosphoglucomutase-like phosphatase (HAD superfamily)